MTKESRMTRAQSIAVRAGGHHSLFRRKTAGFTLIELMIVVAVIAILAAIAYPSYQDSVRKSRRGQAKADMVEYAALAERFRTVNNTYLTAGAVTFTLPSTQSPREVGAQAHYKLALTTQTDDAFTITATAQGGQTKDRCGNLSITSAGVKKNTAGTLSECW
jgi:type IV pilus assembly protein PilE